MLKYLTLILACAKFIRAHPQCLDFEPPFAPSRPLSFCSTYSTSSCCTNAQDENLEKDFSAIKLKSDSTVFSTCSAYIKNILCTKCDPYALHLYDKETNPTKALSFPGLCKSYCSKFYRACSSILSLLTTDSTLLNSGSNKAFCKKLKLSDGDYCYPNVLNNRRLTNLVGADNSTQSKSDCLCVQKVASDLRNPTFGTFSKDQADRFYVLEQKGLVWVYAKDWTRLPTPFLDIQDRVDVTSSTGDERGLLGLAFHPGYNRNKRFFVYYTGNVNDITVIRISEFTATADGMKGEESTEKVMIELPKPSNFLNHNGGMILFGADGMLYAFIGDGGGAGDEYNNAQNRSNLFGTAIRIDVNVASSNTKRYRVPSSNPFVKDITAAPEIFAYGLRNPWRCAVDRGDARTRQGRGRIFCGDVGQGAYEEIDIVKRGKNYGWRAKEGFACYDNNMCGKLNGDALPIHAYGHSVGKCVIGGYVYRGCRSPSLKGAYIYGDYANGKLFRLKQKKPGRPWKNKAISMCSSNLCTGVLKNQYERNILSFAEDYQGEIYMLVTTSPSTDNTQGAIYRVVDPRSRENGTCKFSRPV